MIQFCQNASLVTLKNVSKTLKMYPKLYFCVSLTILLICEVKKLISIEKRGLLNFWVKIETKKTDKMPLVSILLNSPR